MTNNIIQFPDLNAPEVFYQDEDGITWFKYTIAYIDDTIVKRSEEHPEFRIELWATSFDDARRRLQLIKEGGEIHSQILAERYIDD